MVLMRGSVRFVGFNALLAAAYRCSSTDIVDFLLEKGCDPSERDIRMWVLFAFISEKLVTGLLPSLNIYHLACLASNNESVNIY
jgi:ankyrin repeat protein